MTSTPPPGQPQQSGYGAPQQQPGYGAPQQPYGAAPQQPYASQQYDLGQQSYVGYAQPRPKSDKRTFGLWAMIVGLSGLVIPLFLNNAAAIGLGIAGLVREDSKGTSITGIVSGGIGLLIWAPIVWFAIVPLVATLAIFAGVASTSPY